MKIYVDLTREKNCVGLFVHEPVEVIFVGTVAHWEQEKYRHSEPALRLQGLGLHFWFGAAPEPDLYTIPKTTIFAHDGGVGRFLTTEEDDLYYWDGKTVFRICDRLQELPENWRETMEPTDAMEIYPSRSAAEKVHHIYSLTELMEELQ